MFGWLMPLLARETPAAKEVVPSKSYTSLRRTAKVVVHHEGQPLRAGLWITLSRHMSDQGVTCSDVWNSLKGQSLPGKPELDSLLQYDRVQAEWATTQSGKTQYICFFGTTYLDEGGYECIRCLYKSDGEWQTALVWFEDEFTPDMVIAVFTGVDPTKS